jgi:two-component system, chemotaxis family, sensor kinase CheA
MHAANVPSLKAGFVHLNCKCIHPEMNLNNIDPKECHMSIQDDETLQMYLEESLDHLSNIENDFLAIEENGAEIDEDLVNKVYRAAHSIKGGAGFMGLTNIKDLTHEMENILGQIRSRKMIPTPDIVNVLLTASDALKELMDDILNSNEMDISEHVRALQAVLEGGPIPESAAAENPPSQPASPTTETTDQPPIAQDSTADGKLSLALPDGSLAITVPTEKVQPLFEQAKCVYLVKMDVSQDIQGKGKTCQGVLEEMEQTGNIISANFNLEPSDSLDPNWAPDVPIMLFVFSSILKPDDINVLFEIDHDHIFQLRKDYQLYNLNGSPAENESQGTDMQSSAPQESVDELPSTDTLEPQATPEINETKPATEPQQETIVSEPQIESVPVPSVNTAKSTKKQAKVEHETSLRVHVSLLDQLMTLAGELVLSRNQLLQSMTSNDPRGSEVAGQRIDLITSELQEAIMLTRMQSIGNVFNKFPRVVRDLARTLGKEIELTLEGNDVELDKTIIESIGDPLNHLVRNSVDHGVETPSVRRQGGKNPTGQIILKAYHEAGQVNIEITDDGKGLDGDKLAAKAMQKGLISEDQAKLMSTREKTNLIFLPGFSTAEKVTDVSGRGVGMDVVKTNLDQLGGIIDIDSELGKGTTIRIKLPLTLAIIPCQIVLTGGERYAIPQVNLEELLRVPADQVQKRIERVGGADVVRLRGNLLPLIRMADVIGVESQYIDHETGVSKPDRRKSLADRRSKNSPFFDEDSDGSVTESATADALEDSRQIKDRRFHAESALNIVVVSTGATKYGLVVDDLHDSEEIVVKPLGRDLKKCKGYAGATIMGDGRVALILDVSNIAHMAGLTSIEASSRAAEVAQAEKEAVQASLDMQALLIFRCAEHEQFAAPLNLVERIEKIKSTDIENLGGKRVIKYRGGTLPLFSIDEVAMVNPLADTQNKLVIVFNVANREVGLLAMGPVDAQEVKLDIDGVTLRQDGIMGSAIINDNTTLLVDVYEIIKTLNPQWFDEPKVSESTEGEAPTILFAEDSSFFRSQVKTSIEKEGFNVLEAEDGAIAWDLLVENGDKISLVVTDIEMPNMNGFELSEKIKNHSAFSHLPVIALTTLAGEEDISRGKQVGIDDYQIKLDREKLMNSIHDFLRAIAA